MTKLKKGILSARIVLEIMALPLLVWWYIVTKHKAALMLFYLTGILLGSTVICLQIKRG